MKMELIEGSETSAIRTKTPGNHSKENILHISGYLKYRSRDSTCKKKSCWILWIRDVIILIEVFRGVPHCQQTNAEIAYHVLSHVQCSPINLPLFAARQATARIVN